MLLGLGTLNRFRIRSYKYKRRIQNLCALALGSLALKSLTLIFRGRVIPVRPLLQITRLLESFRTDPLVASLSGSMDTIANDTLRQQLQTISMGSASLSVSTLNYLESQIKKFRPRTILEFGSGISTVCLVHYMKEVWGDEEAVYVISVEQEANYAESTLSHLRQLGYSSCAKVIVASIHLQLVYDQLSNCYDISCTPVPDLLCQHSASFVVIDGPSGGGNSRFGTLPLVLPYLASNATFYLDDALRTWELEVATLWGNIPQLDVLGVLPLGRGLLVGKVRLL